MARVSNLIVSKMIIQLKGRVLNSGKGYARGPTRGKAGRPIERKAQGPDIRKTPTLGMD